MKLLPRRSAIDNLYPRTADSREPETLYIPLLERGWVREKLNSGDYRIIAHDSTAIGITRKTISDLLNSIGEVFAKQLDEMLEIYPINVFLLEGNFGLLFESNVIHITTDRGIERMSYSEVANWLHRWLAKGFILERTVNESHSVTRLCELFALYQKPYSMASRSRTWADERLLALPTGVRGATGEKLLAHFGSLAAIATAGEKELREVDGMGPKKIELVIQHFHRDRRTECQQLTLK